ncbi:hypothetical protein LguiA_026016 [Lonicera macranthoides]
MCFQYHLLHLSQKKSGPMTNPTPTTYPTEAALKNSHFFPSSGCGCLSLNIGTVSAISLQLLFN